MPGIAAIQLASSPCQVTTEAMKSGPMVKPNLPPAMYMEDPLPQVRPLMRVTVAAEAG